MEITSAKYIQDEGGSNAFIKVTNSQTVEPDGNGSAQYSICVPMDMANADYQAILEWVDDGNTIADAD